MRNKKGQVATEFFLYTALFMIVAVAALLAIGELNRTEIPLSQNRVVKSVGSGFANVMTMSVKAGEGFTYVYTFPKTVMGRPYKLYYLTEGGIDVLLIEWTGDYGEFSYTYSLPSYDYSVTGCFSDGDVESESCSNTLLISNDGSSLTVYQPEV